MNIQKGLVQVLLPKPGKILVALSGWSINVFQAENVCANNFKGTSVVISSFETLEYLMSALPDDTAAVYAGLGDDDNDGFFFSAGGTASPPSARTLSTRLLIIFFLF